MLLKRAAEFLMHSVTNSSTERLGKKCNNCYLQRKMCVFEVKSLEIKMLKRKCPILHSGKFPEVLFRCENIGRQRDFANF